MAKRRIFKKSRPGEPIYVTKRQLCNYMDAHKDNLSMRDYEKFKRMELVDSPICDALRECLRAGGCGVWVVGGDFKESKNLLRKFFPFCVIRKKKNKFFFFTHFLERANSTSSPLLGVAK